MIVQLLLFNLSEGTTIDDFLAFDRRVIGRYTHYFAPARHRYLGVFEVEDSPSFSYAEVTVIDANTLEEARHVRRALLPDPPEMQDIFDALRRDGTELAQATLKTLNEKSPRGMIVALRLLRLARVSSSLEECLTREYRAALAVFASDDFREGVRAAVIDKDRNPKWLPPRIEDVTPEMIAPYFASLGADELVFD